MKVTAKELLAKVKAIFDTAAPATTPGDTAPADTTGASVYSYAVTGGATVYVDCSDDGIADIDSGDKVYTDPSMTIPYPDGSYTVTGTDFGFTVAGGVVSAVTDADGTGPGLPIEQSTPDAAGAGLAKPPAVPTTPAAMRALYAAFSKGTPDQRIANLEASLKGLGEFAFTLQTANKAQKTVFDKEIATYKATLNLAEGNLTKQEEKMKAMFELMEAIINEPAVEPKTLTDKDKQKFDKTKSKEAAHQRFAAALKQMKEEAAK